MIGRHHSDPSATVDDAPSGSQTEAGFADEQPQPDQPGRSERPAEGPRSQADVMRHVLGLRQEAERHLSESVQVRQAALTEAELTLDSAQEAAELLQAQAQEHADEVLREARERAIGIVEAARMEAEQVRSDVSDELDRLRDERRTEAAAEARADFADLADTASSLSQEMSASFAALREALERAQSSTAGVAERLSTVAVSRASEQVAPPDPGAAHPTSTEQPEPGRAQEPGPSGAAPADEAVAEPADGAPVDAVLVTSPAAEEPEVVEEIEVVDESEPDAVDSDDEQSATSAPIPEPVVGVGRAPSSAPTLRSESHESARPLGWLFRQPQP